MRIVGIAVGLVVLLVAIGSMFLDDFLKSEWFLGPEEERTRCANINDEEAAQRVMEALIAKPYGGVVRGNTTSVENLSVTSLRRPATGEIRIHLEREDGSVVWAVLYEDCVVGWSGPDPQTDRN